MSETQTRLSVTAVLAVLFLTSAFSLRAVPGDEHWDAQFGAPGVTNTTYAVAVNNGTLYVGGVSTGGRTNAPLSVWDGKQWSVAAVFSGPSTMTVNDLAFVGNTLYAAGNFTNVSGVAAYGLAKWDGTSWSSLSLTGVVYALAVDGNNLYVGGNYTNAGGVTVTNIGCWDGSAWHALGPGVGTYAGYSVRAVAVKNGLVLWCRRPACLSSRDGCTTNVRQPRRFRAGQLRWPQLPLRHPRARHGRGLTAWLSAVRPYGSTFFVFTDYMRPSIRLAAIMHIPSIWIFTHDSIGVGEEGPTHQPIEHLAAWRRFRICWCSARPMPTKWPKPTGVSR